MGFKNGPESVQMHARVPPARAYVTGLTVGGLRLICIFHMFGADIQNHKLPSHRPEIWSPGLISCATCTIFRTGSVPGAVGAHRGAPRAEINRRIRVRFYLFMYPKVCSIRRALSRLTR